MVDAIMLSKIWIKQRGLEKVREGGRERERERGREGGRERERMRMNGEWSSSLHYPHLGIWRIHWLSLLIVNILASSLKEDQSADE